MSGSLPLLARSPLLRTGLLTTGSITVIVGVILWIMALNSSFSFTYISNFRVDSPIVELRVFENAPLIQIPCILTGILTLILTRFNKFTALPLGILSTGLLATFATVALTGTNLGGFPLPWMWLTIGRCATCVGQPFFIMIYPFFIDWGTWSIIILSLFFVAWSLRAKDNIPSVTTQRAISRVLL